MENRILYDKSFGNVKEESMPHNIDRANFSLFCDSQNSKYILMSSTLEIDSLFHKEIIPYFLEII